MTPYVSSAAQTPINVDASATRARITGLTNGTGYTFRVAATSTAGTGSASAASERGHPARLDPRVDTPATADAGDAARSSLGRQVQLERRRLHHRRALLQGRREHRHARRRAVERGRDAAGPGHRDDETASGWQAVTFDHPVPITADTTYVASYLAPNGHYSVTGAGFASARSTTTRCARWPTPAANGVYRYSAHLRVPDERLQRDQLLGRRAVRPRVMIRARITSSLLAAAAVTAVLAGCGGDPPASLRQPGQPAWSQQAGGREGDGARARADRRRPRSPASRSSSSASRASPAAASRPAAS